MEKSEFDAWVNRSKERMMRMAEQNKFPNDNMQLVNAIDQGIPVDGKTYGEFLAQNSKTGILKVQVFAANQAIPISNVKVVVSKDFEDGTKVFYEVITDQNGIVEGMILPAPDRKLSEQPSEILPFATYDIFATHPKYVQEKDLQAQIFDGIKSIQQFNMVPLTK